MTTPQTEPTPVHMDTSSAAHAEPSAPIGATDEQIRLTLDALQQAMDALPLDDDLPTPKTVEQNVVRRSLLNSHMSRLRMEHQRVRELAPTPVLLSDWCDTLRECIHDLSAQLTATEDEATHSLRATTLVGQLRQSLADVTHGPDMVGSGEFITDILAQWFADHHVTPLPGESGIFSGRGGLHSAKARLADSLRALTQAQADLEHTLHAAHALLAPAAKEGIPLR